MSKKIYLSYAKVNIFLKIVGTRGAYHEIVSRFVLFKELHDKMWFDKGNGDSFEVVGDFGCERKDNTIYKALMALMDFLPSKQIIDYCKNHKVMVYKKIPAFAGLGGGSSNAATFLHMLNDTLSLGISVEDLANIGAKVGADVPFFVYRYKSANVRGVGEIVEAVEDDDIPQLHLLTPDLRCETPEVYKTFRRNFIDKIEPQFADKLAGLKTSEILKQYHPLELNDLFRAVLKKHPEFYEYNDGRWFLSGSGSSVFKVL